jgi:hypothetical protein
MERDKEDRKERRNIQETEEERREWKGEKRVDKIVAFLHICCFSILKLLLVC